MAHICRQTEDGLVLISRFWLGKTLKNPPLRKGILTEKTARGMAEHCCIEYRNLAQIGHLSLFLKKQEEYLPFSKLAEGLDLDDGYAYFHGILARIVPTAMEIWARDGMRDSPEVVYEKLCRSIRMLGVWFSE